MKQPVFLFILILSLCMSCVKVYNPNINAPQDALVVDGLITNEVKTYWIRLTMSSAFDNPNAGYKFVTGAKLSISDNLWNNYTVTEFKNGMYFTDSTQLVGIPGRTYTLHIATDDGNIYESSPQEILSSTSEDSVYVANTTKTILVSDGFGGYNQITTAGIDLLTDITNNGDVLPRFRFKSTITTESFFSQSKPNPNPDLPDLTVNSYWWNAGSTDDLVNLTGEQYTTTSLNIQAHVICFVPKVIAVTQHRAPAIFVDTTVVPGDTVHIHIGTFDTIIIAKPDTAILKTNVFPTDTTIFAAVNSRIIKVSKYRLNNETYQYYKNINLLLSAQGKIFDPITTQFKGNITCLNNPQKLALGFFEASYVRTNVYTNKPGEIKVYQIQNYSPPSSNGFLMYLNGGPPYFWIN